MKKLIASLGMMFALWTTNAFALDPPYTIDRLRGPYQALCQSCTVDGGGLLWCGSCRTLPPNQPKMWPTLDVSRCANGTIGPDLQSGWLICAPDLGGNIHSLCKNVHVEAAFTFARYLVAKCRVNPAINIYIPTNIEFGNGPGECPDTSRVADWSYQKQKIVCSK